MVDVAAAHFHVAERPDVVCDGENKQAHGKECDEEAYGGEEEPAMRTVGYLLMDEVAEPREVKQKKQHCGDQGGEDEQNPRSSYVHGSGLCLVIAALAITERIPPEKGWSLCRPKVFPMTARC
jgi:hypothetical protein